MKKYFSHLVLATFIVTLFSALGFFAPVIQVRADDRDCSRLDSFGVFVPSNNGMITLGVIGYPNTNTVKIAVPLGTDISKLMTSVKVEPDNINPFCNSVISPPSGSVIDFSHPVVYTVNPFGPLRPGDIRSISDAEALRLARKYTVYVYFPPKITEFKVSAGLLSRNYYGSIDQNARTIALTLPKGIDMTKLIPTIKTFSEGADSVGLNPNYGTLQNQFLNGTIRIRSWYYRQGTSGEIINSYTGGIDQSYKIIISNDPCSVTSKSATSTCSTEEYLITFYANDGAEANYIQTIKVGEKKPLIKNVFTREGYNFMGWATTKSGRAFYNNEQLFSLPRKPVNTVLYAVWTPVTTRTVTFNSNSGIGSYTQDIPVNTSAYLKENQNQINRDGYRFDGWTTNANGTGTYYADGASYPMGRASATLYAKWSQEPGSTMITFNPNWKVCTENQGCPQSGTGIMAPQLIPAGSTTTKLNANTFRPSQRCEISPIGKKECWDAYGFTGWRTAASVSVPGQKGYSDKAVFLPIPGVPSITLYANWYPYGAAAPDSHNYASVSVSWESFLKLLQALR